MSPALLDRLQAATTALADANDAAAAARELRDHLVVEACDAGINQRQVAAAAGVSHSRIIAILAASQPEPAPAPEVVPRDINPAAAA